VFSVTGLAVGGPSAARASKQTAAQRIADEPGQLAMPLINRSMRRANGIGKRALFEYLRAHKSLQLSQHSQRISKQTANERTEQQQRDAESRPA
jgi:hypothetical protein